MMQRPKQKANQQYQAQTAMQYLNDQLRNGWRPEQEKEHTIYLGNPSPPPLKIRLREPKKSRWRLW